jgi:hypothetical protein
MAVSTYTSSIVEKYPAKAPHIGNATVMGRFAWTAAGTVGDVLHLCKVPHGARIIDFAEYHSNGQTAAVIKFGFNKGIAAGGGAHASCLVAAGDVALMNRMSFAAGGASTPLKISLSDTDPIRFALLIGKAASGTFTISVSGTFSLTYSMDEAG